MPLLIFLLVMVVIVGGLLGWYLINSRLRPGSTNMIVIWHANSEPEKEIIVGALCSEGIRPPVVDSGAYDRPEAGSLGSMVAYNLSTRLKGGVRCED